MKPSASSTRRARRRKAATSSGADRKSTRLNSSHANISYAVFCLKKKKSYNRDDTVDSSIINTVSKLIGDDIIRVRCLVAAGCRTLNCDLISLGESDSL